MKFFVDLWGNFRVVNSTMEHTTDTEKGITILDEESIKDAVNTVCALIEKITKPNQYRALLKESEDEDEEGVPDFGEPYLFSLQINGCKIVVTEDDLNERDRVYIGNGKMRVISEKCYKLFDRKHSEMFEKKRDEEKRQRQERWKEFKKNVFFNTEILEQ